MILYEYPFNERIRTLLRLEDLFERFAFFLTQEDAKEHQVALNTLFEISDVAARSDLKPDLIKDLERQRSILLGYRDNPHIEQATLETVLTKIGTALDGLNRMQGKGNQQLIENEWLNSIRSRAVIPGGTCRFDLPAYFAWQQNAASRRREDMTQWATPLLPLRDAIFMALKLARESGCTSQTVAVQGSYQQMLARRSFQLMQIRVPAESRLIPESSSNKYMLWIRFTTQDSNFRTQSVEQDVPFLLTLCTL